MQSYNSLPGPPAQMAGGPTWVITAHLGCAREGKVAVGTGCGWFGEDRGGEKGIFITFPGPSGCP